MKKIIILIPIYNDWESVFHLINNINKEVADLKNSFSILIINDASTQKRPDQKFNSKNIHSIKTLIHTNLNYKSKRLAFMYWITSKSFFLPSNSFFTFS